MLDRVSARPLASAFIVAWMLTSAAWAQKPPVGPPAPMVNPAQAHLEFTLTGLGGTGLAIASNDEMDAVAAGCDDGSIYLWEKAAVAPGMVLDRPTTTLKAHQGPVLAVAWTGGPILASAGADQKIILWKMADKKLAFTLPTGSIVRALAMSPDGKRLASSNDDHSIQLTDVAAGKFGAKLTDHTDWILALAFSADGKRLASAGYDGIVRIWDVEAGKKVLEISLKPPVPPPPPPPKPPATAPIVVPPSPTILTAVAFSPDGKLLAIGGPDGQIVLHNPADGKLIRPVPGHTSVVSGLVFHPNNAMLISGSKDRTVRLWNVADGKSLKVLEGHTAWVQGLTLTSRGMRVASVGADPAVRVWDLQEPVKKK